MESETYKVFGQAGLTALGFQERVKFNFEGLDKYIVLVLNTKIALEELKFTFSSILKIDFFARRLEYFIKDKFNNKTQLHINEPLSQWRIDQYNNTNYNDKMEVNDINMNTTIENHVQHFLQIYVQIVEEGA